MGCQKWVIGRQRWPKSKIYFFNTFFPHKSNFVLLFSQKNSDDAYPLLRYSNNNNTLYWGLFFTLFTKKLMFTSSPLYFFTSLLFHFFTSLLTKRLFSPSRCLFLSSWPSLGETYIYFVKLNETDRNIKWKELLMIFTWSSVIPACPGFFLISFFIIFLWC